MLPGGQLDEIIVYAWIRVAGVDGTTITTLKSDHTFGDISDLFATYVSTAQVTNLDIGDGKAIFIYNSIIVNTINPTINSYLYASNTKFFGGDFENITNPYEFSFCTFQSVNADLLNLPSTNYKNCSIATLLGNVKIKEKIRSELKYVEHVRK